MNSLSRNILSVLLPFSVLFSKPSWQKALTLLLGAIICTGKRTVCAALRAMGLAYEPGFAKYHHLLKSKLRNFLVLGISLSKTYALKKSWQIKFFAYD